MGGHISTEMETPLPETRSFVLRVNAPRGLSVAERLVRLEDVSAAKVTHFPTLKEAFLAIRQALEASEAPGAASAKPH